MRNKIAKIYILSLIILTQTGCDKNDRAVAVRDANPALSAPILIDQRADDHQIFFPTPPWLISNNLQ